MTSSEETEILDLAKYMEPLIAGLFAVRGDILSADEQRTAAETIVRCLSKHNTEEEQS